MSIPQTLFGVVFTIPEDDEVDWGLQVTTLLVDICKGLNQVLGLSINGQGVPILVSTTTTLAAASTLTVTSPTHKVTGTPGAVTLSAVTAIANGDVVDQMVLIQGNHAVNSVTILDGANTRLNGNITLFLGQSILLRWDVTDSNWWEISRNN